MNRKEYDMTAADKHYEKMTKTPVSKLILRLGIPTTVSMLITNIYNLADTYFVGQLGESPQAATGILFTLQCIIQAVAFMLGHGSGTFVSKALADKDTDEATCYVSSAFFVGGAVGILLSVFGLIFLTPFMRLLGSTETILPYAKDYGMWVLISCPFMICSLVLNNNLRYEGKAFYAMFGLTAGGILNILGDWFLIQKLHMGVYGAGLSTAVSQMVSFLILLILYFRTAQSTISLRAVSCRWTIYAGIVKVGFPSLIRQGLASVSHGLLNNLTKVYGDAAIAAMSVVNRFSSLVMCVGLGIGQGFQPVAAFNYRAKEYKRVKQGLIFTTVVGLVVVAGLSFVGFLFAESIIRVFQESEAVIRVGTPALRYATVGLLFLPLSVPVNMLYQSIRRAGVASFLSILRSGAMLIPTLLLTVHFWGLTGVQISQPIADMLSGLICVPFIIHFMRHGGENEETK